MQTNTNDGKCNFIYELCLTLNDDTTDLNRIENITFENYNLLKVGSKNSFFRDLNKNRRTR
jgi:hypothetical protein